MRSLFLAALLLAGCGGGSSMGTQKLGDTCAADDDCESGMCRAFQMMTVQKCTQACTKATEATDCPVPPTSGKCNQNGYCRM